MIIKMNEKDFSELGKEIGERIEKFVNSNEVKDLQENIRATVNQTMDEVKRSLKEAADSVSTTTTKTADTWSEGLKTYQPKTVQTRQPAVSKRMLPIVKRPPGSVAGVLLTVFGVIGLVAFAGLSTIGTASMFLFESMYSVLMVVLGFSIPAAVGFAIMLAAGGIFRRRAGRFKAYVKALNERDFYSVEGLARAVNKKEKFVIKDIKKMISRRWFKEGHLDEKETCFMLTDDAFRLYQEAQMNLEQRRLEEQQKEKAAALLEQDPERKQMIAAVEEGREYIRRIRKVNDEMPGEEISTELYRLEKINTRIFEYVEKNPDRLPYIRKFMSYYLPTTLKLVEAYAEFSAQPVQGDNIKAAKKEIEEMMDDINKAFEKMFDKLFAEDAMDISADISVLSAMLAQEGLLEDEFKMDDQQ